MKICNLASSSSGNSTYIETEKYKILIDIGKNKKYITQKLNDIGVDYRDIDYLFLTHTHDDHTAGLHTFLKNNKTILVVTNEMFAQLSDIDNFHILTYDDDPIIDGLDIKSFKMSHDAGDTRCFLITENNQSLVYITDTGYVNSRYFNQLKGKTMYAIESNYDVEMLTHGPYPKWLQKRITSSVGHLSNEFTGIYLSKLINDNTKVVMLLHLSESNNNPDKALGKVSEYIDANSIKLFCTKKEEASEVVNL